MSQNPVESSNVMLDKLLVMAQNPDMTDAQRMELTQGVRQAMLFENLKAGIPTGKETYRMLKILEDIDKTAMDNKKLQSDDANAQSDREALILIGQIHAQVNGKNPFMVDGNAPARDVTPKMGELPSRQLQPDEDAVGIATLTYEDFEKNNGHLMVATETEEDDDD